MILDAIATSTRKRVILARQQVPLDAVKEQALSLSASRSDAEYRFPFEKALSLPGISFICEVKKGSPSKGIIAEDFPYLQIAQEYERAGAAAVSVLTEPEYFFGNDRYLREIAHTVQIPVLRKDFIIDEYQIYEAKVLGAAAILLICALLDVSTLRSYITIAHNLGLSALVEAHTEAEVAQALSCGARIIGVNNRNLKTFQVDLTVSLRLRNLVPVDILFVAESGIQSAEDIRILKSYGVDAVLMGEAMMRAADKQAYLAQLRGNSDGKH
jgi:indole-3-glycerol phosphate synthase